MYAFNWKQSLWWKDNGEKKRNKGHFDHSLVAKLHRWNNNISHPLQVSFLFYFIFLFSVGSMSNVRLELRTLTSRATLSTDRASQVPPPPFQGLFFVFLNQPQGSRMDMRFRKSWLRAWGFGVRQTSSEDRSCSVITTFMAVDKWLR